MNEASPPVALTIAGSDSCGGAGIQADLRTFAAVAVHGACAITALTAQNTLGVAAVHGVPGAFVRQQIDAVAAEFTVGAVKTGMLAARDIVLAVAAAVRAHDLGPLVVDPVMIASSGARLLPDDAVAVLLERLIPRAALVTPNLFEAAALLGVEPACDVEAMIAQARALLAIGARGVLIKGGHGTGADSVDVLATGHGIETFALPRIDTRGVHGTGCTLSAAITAHLARGNPLNEAVREAKAHVWRAIASGLGRGAGILGPG